MDRGNQAMCKKLHYCNTKIDQCIQQVIKDINTTWEGLYETVASCCGHKVFPTTIVVHDIHNDTYFEWYTKRWLKGKYKNGKPRKRWYKRRGKYRGSMYYLPEET